MFGDRPADADYADLEIRIFPRRDKGYPVEITLGGQHRFQRGHLSADIASWIPTGDPIADGHRLSSAFFADPVLRRAWDRACGPVLQHRMRLWIDEQAAELHNLPWELLRTDEGMLAANAGTPFSRYLSSIWPWSGTIKKWPIRVLAVISNPSDLDQYGLGQLDVALERAALEGALGNIDDRDIRLEFLEAPVTLEALEKELRKRYHVLHYIGHGMIHREKGQAALCLQDEAGSTHIVTNDELIDMLARQQERPRLIFLTACQSATPRTTEAFLGLGPRLVSKGVPAVVAMQGRITVETARKLGQVFYERLVQHGLVDLAMNEARSTLVTTGRPDAQVPVIFMRLESGQLWEKAEARDRNPYIYGPLVTNPDMFFGREAILDELYTRLNNMQSTSIVGLRRIGKSSLLYQLTRTLPDTLGHNFVALYVDLTQGNFYTATDFVKTVATKLNQATALSLTTSSVADMASFSTLIEELSSHNIHPVLCLDEFEGLIQHPEEFNNNFFNVLRALNSQAKLAMVTASRRPLSDLRRDSKLTSPFFNIFSQIELGLLERDAARALRRVPFERQGINPSQEDKTLIKELAGRHPFFLQMACHYLYEARHEPQDTRANLVRERFNRDSEPHFRWLWKHLQDDKETATALRAVIDRTTPEDETKRKLEGLARLGVMEQPADESWEVFSVAFSTSAQVFSAALNERVSQQESKEHLDLSAEALLEALREYPAPIQDTLLPARSPPAESVQQPPARPQVQATSRQRDEIPVRELEKPIEHPLPNTAWVWLFVVTVIVTVVIAVFASSLVPERRIRAMLIIEALILLFTVVGAAKLTDHDLLRWLGRLLRIGRA